MSVGDWNFGLAGDILRDPNYQIINCTDHKFDWSTPKAYHVFVIVLTSIYICLAGR
jgi:hypothetical protein